MEITGAIATASAIKNSAIQNEVRTAVAAKVADVAKEQGEALVQLIDQAAQVQGNSASNGGLDIRA